MIAEYAATGLPPAYLSTPEEDPHEPEAAGLYGLKYNPFIPEVPIKAIYVSPKIENFCWRIEQAHLREGGFALVHGYEKEPVMKTVRRMPLIYFRSVR